MSDRKHVGAYYTPYFYISLILQPFYQTNNLNDNFYTIKLKPSADFCAFKVLSLISVRGLRLYLFFAYYKSAYIHSLALFPVAILIL